ncbi:hypothetical protein NEOKW01_1106 [Nematocida sp. AWRm80]|nr:hypothetical protein NEOKW01_1106 [Nematocida sp. AWRm80]
MQPDLSSTNALLLIKEIKNRLSNLQKQKEYLYNREIPVFTPPLTDLLARISNEEEYLKKEAARIKETHVFYTDTKCKYSTDPDITTIIEDTL